MKNKTILRIAKYAGAISITLMLFALMIFIKKPAYMIGGIKIDNIDNPDVQTKIEAEVKQFDETKKLIFSYSDKKTSIAPSSIDAKWDIAKTIKALKEYRNLRFTTDPIQTPLYVDFNEEKLIKQISEAYKGEIKEMKPAKITYTAGEFKIAKAQKGGRLRPAAALKNAGSVLANLSEEEIKIEFERIPPPITAEDLSVYFDTITAALKRSIKIQYGFVSFTFIPRVHLNAIYYQKEYGAKNGENLKIKLDPEQITKSFIAQITQTINKKTSPIKIHKDSTGKIIFEGKSEKGEEVNVDQLMALMEIAINENVQAVKIPVEETPPDVMASQELQDMGIKELIGVGHTSFYKSPANRVHNIKVGLAKFNGVMMSPGEEFSFNKTLGKVDAGTGYLKELVIKPEGTVPEYGGGLCQVSTTMYRAAIYTGLPIIERSPHSYAVTYYSQIGGHGLDATVYPGAHDLKFKNNTPAYILIQAYVEGMEAYYKFYGTSDKRKVELDGPYLSNFRSSGGKEIIKTTNLKPGERKQIESSGKGFDAIWYRTITLADGTSAKEKIFSSYRATADRFLEGAEETPVEPQMPPESIKTPEFKD